MNLLKPGIWVALALNLSACIVVPYDASQDHVGGRSDVPTAVPDTIVKGKTTRAEVLKALGKPDAEGQDSDWFVYSSTAKESGLGLFFCFAIKDRAGCGDARRQVWDYQRLVVRFDPAGVVSDAHVDSASCIRWTGADRTPVPCLDVRGDDLRRQDALASLKGAQVLTTYPKVRWPADQENDCTFYGKLIVTQGWLYLVSDAGSPVDRHLVRVDPARCPEPDSVVSFDDADIADVSIVEGMRDYQSVKLSRKDGSHFSFQLLSKVHDEGPAPDSTVGKAFKAAGDVLITEDEDDDKVDDDTFGHATELAADIQKATGKAPDSYGGLNSQTDTDSTSVPRTYDHVRWCSGWAPPTIAIVQRQTPCDRPKDGYLILTADGFMFQLADAGDGVQGVVAGRYADVQSESLRDSGHWGSYSHWVVVTKKDGEIDAFDPDYSDARQEIDAIMRSHLSPPAPASPAAGH